MELNTEKLIDIAQDIPILLTSEPAKFWWDKVTEYYNDKYGSINMPELLSMKIDSIKDKYDSSAHKLFDKISEKSKQNHNKTSKTSKVNKSNRTNKTRNDEGSFYNSMMSVRKLLQNKTINSKEFQYIKNTLQKYYSDNIDANLSREIEKINEFAKNHNNINTNIVRKYVSLFSKNVKEDIISEGWRDNIDNFLRNAGFDIGFSRINKNIAIKILSTIENHAEKYGYSNKTKYTNNIDDIRNITNKYEEYVDNLSDYIDQIYKNTAQTIVKNFNGDLDKFDKNYRIGWDNAGNILFVLRKMSNGLYRMVQYNQLDDNNKTTLKKWILYIRNKAEKESQRQIKPYADKLVKNIQQQINKICDDCDVRYDFANRKILVRSF